MLIVVALGGNALLRRGERADADVQRAHVREAALVLAPIIAEHDVLVCHGNGPQIGLLAVESEADPALERPYPLDVLGAQTQGMIGYWLAQELHGAGVSRPIVAVLTQTVVDAADPRFAEPTKFIGRAYGRADAEDLAALHGWSVAPDGQVWRRVVPSPAPVRIVEQASIRRLLDVHTVVVCGGGGGIPVIEDGSGALVGVEAVVDKDLTAARLAVDLDADAFLVLTDVPAVMLRFGSPEAMPLHRIRLEDVGELRLPAGSMGPKVQACGLFTAATGRPSVIGAIRDAGALLAGEAGTTVVGDRAGVLVPS